MISGRQCESNSDLIHEISGRQCEFSSDLINEITGVLTLPTPDELALSCGFTSSPTMFSRGIIFGDFTVNFVFFALCSRAEAEGVNHGSDLLKAQPLQ